MSHHQFKTYDINDLVAIISDTPDVFPPGTLVKHQRASYSQGIVIATNWVNKGKTDTGGMHWSHECTVLWTIEPSPFIDFAEPRRVNMMTVANELVPIQPMLVPASLIFYLDYTHGSGSKDPV